jgi:hypothetical protein
MSDYLTAAAEAGRFQQGAVHQLTFFELLLAHPHPHRRRQPKLFPFLLVFVCVENSHNQDFKQVWSLMLFTY